MNGASTKKEGTSYLKEEVCISVVSWGRLGTLLLTFTVKLVRFVAP